jgi:transcriptional regulator with XRE-family HTH domain
VTLAKRAGFKKKLSVADLADVLGVNRVAVYLWEHDRKAPSSAARRLLEILWLVPEAAPGLIAKDGAWRKCLERKTRKRRVGK